MNLRKAAEMALECLNYHWDYFEDESGDGLYVLEAKKALRQALALPVDLAKVGEVGVWGEDREWVGLTDDELEDLEFASVDREYGHLDIRVLSKAIEAKLKEKNT
jgi:hypothetical protein